MSRGIYFCTEYFRLKYSSVYIQRKSLESTQFLSEWYCLKISYSAFSNKEKKANFCNKALSLFFESIAEMLSKVCFRLVQVQYHVIRSMELIAVSNDQQTSFQMALGL